jgi:hypothetical protein
VLVSNTTMAGNRAAAAGALGNQGGTLILSNTTVADHHAAIIAGGIWNESGTVELQNTILARNTTIDGEGPDCRGSITSLGNNLIGDLTGCDITLLPSDLTGDPGLGAFTDDGTPGHGHFPLLPTSQAIDAGNDAVCPDTDQLGQPRVGPCDIGAIEFQGAVDTIPPTITISARPATLWPPNGKRVPVTVSGTITDEPGGAGWIWGVAHTW